MDDYRDKQMRTYNYRHEKCAVDDYRDDNQTAVDTVTGFVVTKSSPQRFCRNDKKKEVIAVMALS